MGRFVQVVMGPAGVGKSTYCKIMQEHAKNSRRTIHVANLDPAAEVFEYDASFDIRDFINIDRVMEENGFGPNGGLVYCMEYLIQNSEWLKDELDQFGEDEYVILDCPGQMELYTHLPIMRNLMKLLTMWGYRVVGAYLMDSLFVLESSKFISGCMLSLSCMLQLGVPHVNVITKCDVADKDHIERVLDAEDSSVLLRSFPEDHLSNQKFRRLTQAIGSIIDDYMLVSFATMDITDEDSINDVLTRLDFSIQYGKGYDKNHYRIRI
jgi:hypothetical protein